MVAQIEEFRSGLKGSTPHPPSPLIKAKLEESGPPRTIVELVEDT